jgi:tetratricopeptide (TPR) repeat protein
LKSRDTIIAAVVLVALSGIAGYFLGARSTRSGPATSSYGGQYGGSGGPSQPNTGTALIDDLKARLNANPRDIDIMLRLADEYFELKRFSEATAHYKKALDITPNDTEIYNNLGLAVHYMGDTAEGVKYVEEGIKRNPYHQRIWLTKGFLLMYGLGDLEGARSAWQKASALDPESQIGKAASDYLAQLEKR